MSLLFNSPLPWEYPTKVAELFAECERQGVAKEFAGGARKQHLSVWAIEAEAAESIRLTISQIGDSENIAELREKFAGSLLNVLGEMSISWCPVIEARSEVTARRISSRLYRIFETRQLVFGAVGPSELRLPFISVVLERGV